MDNELQTIQSLQRWRPCLHVGSNVIQESLYNLNWPTK